LQVRESPVPEEIAAVVDSARSGSSRVHLGRKDPRFWPSVAVVLDVLTEVSGRVSEAAERLGLSTGNLIDLLQTHEKVWAEVNHLRMRFGHKALH